MRKPMSQFRSFMNRATVKPYRFLQLCLLWTASQAIYQDQLGKFDWHRQQLGKLEFVALSSKKSRLLGTTVEGVVSNINLRDGSIVWRQKMEDRILDLFVYERENLMLTLTSRQMIGWDLMDGSAKWEVPLEENVDGHLFLEETGNGWVLMKGPNLELRHPITGSVIWSIDTELTAKNRNTVFLTEASGFLYVAGFGEKMKILKISIESGEVLSSSTVNFDSFTRVVQKSCSLRILEDWMVLVCSSELCWAPLKEGTTTATCEKQENSKIYPLKKSLLKHSLQNPGQASLLEFKNGELVELKYIIGYIGHSRGGSLPGQDSLAILTKNQTSSNLKITVLDPSNGLELLQEDYTMLPATFELNSVFLGNYKRKDASYGYRYLLIGRFGEVLLLQQNQLVWQRNEAPSGARKALFIDPPTPASSSDSTPKFSTWIHAQFLSLKVQFQLSSPKEKTQLMELKRDLSGKNLMTKDSSGYRKIIIILSKFNCLLALHNGDGRVLWQINLPDWTPTGLTHYSYSHEKHQPPQLLIYSLGSVGEYMVVDGHQGDILDQGKFPGKVTKIVKLPHVARIGKLDQNLFLLIDESTHGLPTGYLFPSLEDYPIEEIRRFVFWRAVPEQGRMEGFGIRKIDLQTKQVMLTSSWSLSFHSPIQLSTERSFEDPVHSYTKVLGDRSLLFKYLNPNTALVITGGVSAADLGSEFEEQDLEVFLVDTVTGRIVFRQVHESAKGPVHGLITQHWAVYHYWSITNQRYQISTLEMYDTSHRQLTLSDLFLRGILELSEEISSYQPTPVQVYNATFFTSLPVKTLAVTRTLRGITTQILLMGTQMDQIYSMNKRFLDPRRPIRANKETRDERLIPFGENLPVASNHYASYDHLIMGLQQIITTPTGLESASHVFSFGLDLYYVRLQPERGFDTLDEDFNFGFLLLTLLAMILVSIICRRLVKSAQLSQKWK